MNKRGFTLIELLAVIAILAILIVIAVPGILKVFNKAKDSVCITEIKSIYQTANNKYLSDSIMGKNNSSTYSSSSNQLDINTKKEYVAIFSNNGKLIYFMVTSQECSAEITNSNGVTVEQIEESVASGPIFEKTLADIGSNVSDTCVLTGTCSDTQIVNGVSVDINVNFNTKYKFYVLADDGTYVDLLMEMNLGANGPDYTGEEDTYWTLNNEEYEEYGGSGIYCQDTLYDVPPINILRELNSRTSSWIYITPQTYTVSGLSSSDSVRVYDDQTTTSRGKFISYNEIKRITDLNSDLVPSWMFTNLSTDVIGSGYGSGYYTSTIPSSANCSNPWSIGARDGYESHSKLDSRRRAAMGIRPVIRVRKS